MERKKICSLRRQKRVRRKLPREGFRLSIFRSNRYLFAQIIDQKTGKTIFGLGERGLLSAQGGKKKSKSERAKELGIKFAQRALRQKIEQVIFDRGSFRYHGRIKAFAEGAQEGGLKF